ncbi:MAG: hypothetical protein JNM68_01650 [Dinghuibacter sp.]|nr:hypothetical protein [Dinghuibacter sp.]
MKKQNRKANGKKPFFAHLLTKHEMQRAAAGTGQGANYQTAKSPSDKDETLPVLDAVSGTGTGSGSGAA